MSDFIATRKFAPSLPFVAALVFAAVSFTLPAVGNAETTVTCESHSNQRNNCRADTRGGVSLQTQLSKAGCYQGNSWGYDSRFIWVSNGCRAVFRTGSDNHRNDHGSSSAGAAVAGLALLALGAAAVHEAHKDHRRDNYDDNYDYRHNDDHYDHYNDRYDRNQTVTCESQGNRYNYCRANIRHNHVRLLRQLSKSSCRHGDDWGYDRRGIWVENGCRATFEVERD